MTTETINAEIKAEDIGTLLNKHGARSFLVGGCVRDKLLGIEPKDYDIEVYGLTPEKLKSIIRDHYILDEIGASFQVLKIKGWDIEISTPRREVQIGDKHTSFKTEYDPNMSYVDACSRRDVTCNAIMQCLTTGEYIDPLGGIEDLRDKIIKPTSPRFKEDPLRVLRAMQFIGRFEMHWTIELQEMCSELNPSQLSRERIWEEWLKYLLKSTPDGIIMGWQFLRDCEWTKYFPEIHNLIGCPQSELNHPEGCVWTHTGFCLQEYAKHRTGNEYEDIVVGLAVLCHDFGKPQWTRYEEGKFKAHGHEKGGEDPTRRFLGGITNQRNIIEDVVALVVNHLKPVQLHKANSKMGAVRRLALRIPIERLLRVCTADIHEDLLLYQTLPHVTGYV